MELGNSLFQARKRNGFPRRKTQRKNWESAGRRFPNGETGETLPDLCQAQRLACLYRMSLDNLAALILKRRG